MLHKGPQQRCWRWTRLIQAQPQPLPVGSLHFYLRRGHAPGRMHFHKGQSGWQGGHAGGTRLSSAVLAQALETEPKLLGDASEGEFAGQGDRVFPEHWRNPATWRAPAPPPLSKLLHDVV